MTDKRSFLQISPAECGRYYPVAVQSGQRHLRIARHIAIIEEYGSAISHLVLGAEELLKGVVLLMDYRGFQLRQVKAIKRIFSQHRARHAVLKEAFSVWLALSQVLGKKMSFLNFLAGALEGITNYYWWRQADNLKNQGFYVDFWDVLLDPGSITRDQYRQALRHVLSLQREVEGFIIFLNTKSEAELLDLRELVKQSRLGDLLEESITRDDKPH
jgi:AbiV family abortive infection protein